MGWEGDDDDAEKLRRCWLCLRKKQDHDHQLRKLRCNYMLHILALVLVVVRGRGCACETQAKCPFSYSRVRSSTSSHFFFFAFHHASASPNHIHKHSHHTPTPTPPIQAHVENGTLAVRLRSLRSVVCLVSSFPFPGRPEAAAAGGTQQEALLLWLSIPLTPVPLALGGAWQGWWGEEGKGGQRWQTPARCFP